ncbi:MAG: HlyD family efflux transporter periplasmic adaptor subunit, partial [Sulfitobacter sp.]
MRFLRQSMIGLFLTAVTLGLLLYAGQLIGSALQDRMARDTKAPPVRERVFAVNVIMAEASNQTPVLEAFGEVQSRRTLELRAATGGRVIELAPGFEDGSTVTKGQVLVRIDPAGMQAEVDRLKSDLADAEAEGRDANRSVILARDEEVAAQEQSEIRERAFRRQVDLTARGVGTAAAVETAELAAASARQAVLSRRLAVTQSEARIDQAATRVTRSKIALAEAERQLADTILRAPFDGTLSATSVVEGRLVSPNERVAELIDPDDLEVSFRVSTAQYARLLDGAGKLLKADVTANLDVTGIDLTARGQISRASAAAGTGQTGRLVFARLTSAPGFKPGDFVTVRVSEPELQNVVRLPASALDASGVVLVMDEGDRLAAIDVTLLRRQGDDILVSDDRLAGREVVVARSP